LREEQKSTENISVRCVILKIAGIGKEEQAECTMSLKFIE